MAEEMEGSHMAKIGTGAAEGMEVLENHAVVVEGRRIVDVAPLADTDLSGCETFDLRGCLFASRPHKHACASGRQRQTPEEAA